MKWKTPYLGYNIEGTYPTNDLLSNLNALKIVGVANGRAEFGPRALGNRSLLADPKGSEMKDVVNKIKKRQEDNQHAVRQHFKGYLFREDEKATLKKKVF